MTVMRTNYRTGLRAEALCCLVLRLKLYRILATRYKTPVGEIDILAAKGNTLVAVEVKARATGDAAVEAILPRQQNRIAQALQYFAMSHTRFANADMRFDVMLATPRAWPKHIKNAWFVD